MDNDNLNDPKKNRLLSNKKILMPLLLILVVVVVIGTSFALWQLTFRQTGTNVITTDCFKISFKDDNPINLQEVLPITDEIGRKLKPYEFTITNMCNSIASYQINLEVLDDTTLPKLGIIKMLLNEKLVNKDSVLLTSNEEVDKTLSNANKSYKIETGYLLSNNSKDFELRLWIDENAETKEDFMNKLFTSKVTIITSYYKDNVAPTPSLTVTSGVGSLTVDASQSNDNVAGIKKYYYSIDGENYIESEESTYTFENLTNPKYTVYVKIEDNSGNISEPEKIEADVKLNGTAVITNLVGNGQVLRDGTADNNIRYVGANPNNYVRFNNELWRIIGVMNNMKTNASDKGEARLKIIRATPYSNSMAWNTNGNRNSWSTSTSNSTLNGTFYNSFTESAKNMTAVTLWNTGEVAAVGDQYAKTDGDTAWNFYTQERGTKVGSSSYGPHSPTWTGRIAMMYASDYGFATSGGGSNSRETCLNKRLYNWRNVSDCYGNSWLYRSGVAQWTLSIEISSPNAVFLIYGNGNNGSVGFPSTNYDSKQSITPALYLKSNVIITSGNGTSSSPFELSLS